MNPNKLRIVFLIAIILTVLFNLVSEAQVVVDNKNLNEDKDLKYIQLMYYIEKSTMKPVYFLDYGFIEPEYNDILEPEAIYAYPTIKINGSELTDRVSPVGVLNKLDDAGWEYTGDMLFERVGMMRNWHVFTLRRKG
jgi:hypothetical protein